jgi:Protein of unknown function (DUF5132)
MKRYQRRKPTQERNGAASARERVIHGGSAGARDNLRGNAQDDEMSLATSVTLIAIGALLRPRLLAGMAVGAGIVLASRRLSGVNTELMRPLLKAAIKAGHAAAATAQDMMAEFSEQLQDLAAEAHAEHQQDTSADGY